MLMIRLQRTGRRNDPAYRISVLEKARAARTGRVVESIGSYNPKTKQFAVDEVRVKEWITHGAQPTGTVRNLFIGKGVLSGKQTDVFPASARKKAHEAAERAAGEAATAANAASSAPSEQPPVEVQAETPVAEPIVEEAPADMPSVALTGESAAESEDGAGSSVS